MCEESYKENLKEVLENLEKANELILDSMISIALKGELLEWSNSVPVGEDHYFSKELFEGCDDYNIQLLVSLAEKLDETYESLININNIKLDASQIA